MLTENFRKPDRALFASARRLRELVYDVYAVHSGWFTVFHAGPNTCIAKLDRLRDGTI
jgi:hypothetical protein